MAELTQKTTHTAEALDHLLEVLKGKPDLAAFITPFIDQIQDAENAAFELIDERTIAAAVGVQLDGIGQIIGETRDGRTDDDYRAGLQAKILINKTSGTIEEIIEIIDILISNSIEFEDLYPASFYVTIVGALVDLDPVLLAGIVSSAKPAAVRGAIIHQSDTDANTFTLASGDAVETSSTQGLGNDAGTTGGKLRQAEGL